MWPCLLFLGVHAAEFLQLREDYNTDLATWKGAMQPILGQNLRMKRDSRCQCFRHSSRMADVSQHTEEARALLEQQMEAMRGSLELPKWTLYFLRGPERSLCSWR